MIAILEWKVTYNKNIEQLQAPTMGVTINKKSTTTEPNSVLIFHYVLDVICFMFIFTVILWCSSSEKYTFKLQKFNVGFDGNGNYYLKIISGQTSLLLKIMTQ